MKALKQAEESKQGVQGEGEPTFKELTDELSLEPRSHSPELKKAEASESPPASMSHEAANLFAAKNPQLVGRKHTFVILVTGALLLLAGGGAYVYIAISHPAWLISAPRQGQSSLPVVAVVPATPQADNLPLPVATSSPVVEAEGEIRGRLASAEKTVLPAFAPAQRARNNRATEPESESPIKVTRGNQIEINPDLAQGYQALQEGRLEAAQLRYQRLLNQEPRNVDALLGLAAVALRSNNPGEGGKYYLRILDVEPKNAIAQAGLLNLMGSTDFSGSETRLKRLLADQPSAFLYETLGNLYAAEERWPDAQQAYFQAYHLESSNPDHAFNLAVSLEHLHQPRLALTYYQKALQLLPRDGATTIDRAALEARVFSLKRTAE